MMLKASLCVVLLLGSVLLLQGARQDERHVLKEGPAAADSSAAALSERAADKLAAVQQLSNMLQENGAEVNVEVRKANEQAGLAMFAQRDLMAGDTIIALPTDLCFRALAASGIMDFLLDLVLDFHNKSSPNSLMWATMPHPTEVHHLLNFPQQYLPLLQHKDMEEWMGRGLHDDLRLFQQMHADVLNAANISYDDIVHVMGVAGTRFFTRPVPENEQLTIYYGFPLLDMANHNNSCPHFMEFGPCLSNPTRECAFFTAGADVDSGQEVCFWYGHLLPDRAFLEYGFLPAEAVAGASKPRKQKVKRNRAAAAAEAAANGGAQNGTATAAPKRKRARKAVAAADALLPAVPLFGIDRHDFDAANPLPKLQAPPHDFINNITIVNERIDKLHQLSAALKAGDKLAAEIAAQGPAPSDQDGSFLQDVLAWRQQRQAGVDGEIARLERLRTNYKIKKALTVKHRR